MTVKFDAGKFLDDNPGIRHTMYKVLSLYDAADVLDHEKPPHGTVAAAFLREVADELMRRMGADEAFIRAAITGRPAPAWKQ